ncbi:hypothetical protein IT570_13630 [Candidatus Sumerlaeota bacterium]|nr:hypothetical protein [Candidatus Sumerlaeota bacterium]
MNEREKFDELIGDYAEGTLSSTDAVAWNELLASHPELRAEAEQERALVLIMRKAALLKAPKSLKAEVLAEVSAKSQVIVVPRRGTRALWQLAALAAIVIVGIFVYTNDEPQEAKKSASVPERLGVTEPYFNRTPVGSAQPSAAAPASLRSEVASKKSTAAAPNEEVLHDSGTLVPQARSGIRANEVNIRQLSIHGSAEVDERKDSPQAGLTESLDQIVPTAQAVPERASAPEEAPMLPTRRQVRDAVIAKAGRVLLDTPWYETAAYHDGDRSLVSDRATDPHARYIVAQIPTSEDAIQLFRTMGRGQDQQAPDASKEKAATKPDGKVRVVIPYATEQTNETEGDEGKLALKDSAEAPVAFTSAQATKEEARQRELRSASAPVADKVPLGKGTGKPGVILQTFEDFDNWVRAGGAQFLFCTPSRNIAFSEEVNARTPAPMTRKADAVEYNSYLVYHFKVAKQADAILGKLPELGGVGVRNVGIGEAELVAQPDGVRLVIPYRMEGVSQK